MEIYYVTGNNSKFHMAEKALKGTNIKLIQKKLDIPEIQSVDIAEVAENKGLWARNQVKGNVMVADAGFYINGLKGFPGPYIKYINNWLSAEDLLRLLENKKDRTITIRDCMVYCSMDGTVKIFQHEVNGIITDTIKSDKGSPIEKIVIPESLDRTLAELTEEESLEFWSKNSTDIQFRKWIETTSL